MSFTATQFAGKGRATLATSKAQITDIVPQQQPSLVSPMLTKASAVGMASRGRWLAPPGVVT
jgi:hypothetical protein